MTRSRKIQGVILGGAVVLIGGVAVALIGVVKTWPLVIEPNPVNSLKIYSAYVLRGQRRISDLLGNVDIACAIGPYESYTGLRFSKMLSEKQMVAANAAIEKGYYNDYSFILVGWRGDNVKSLYVSSVFHNLTSIDEHSSSANNCVGGGGLIFPQIPRGGFGRTIALRLTKGA